MRIINSTLIDIVTMFFIAFSLQFGSFGAILYLDSLWGRPLNKIMGTIQQELLKVFLHPPPPLERESLI
jgi:hypothetical protein